MTNAKRDLFSALTVIFRPPQAGPGPSSDGLVSGQQENIALSFDIALLHGSLERLGELLRQLNGWRISTPFLRALLVLEFVLKLWLYCR